MSMNNKGYTLIEVLVASSLLFIMISIIIPISMLLKYEQSVLKDRRFIASYLHDELQLFLWNNQQSPPVSYTKNRNEKVIYLRFEYKKNQDMIEGCATWENVKQRKEEICIYGYPEK